MLGNHRHREGDSDHGFVTESHGSATDEAGSPTASASFFGLVISPDCAQIYIFLRQKNCHGFGGLFYYLTIINKAIKQ